MTTVTHPYTHRRWIGQDETKEWLSEFGELALLVTITLKDNIPGSLDRIRERAEAALKIYLAIINRKYLKNQFKRGEATFPGCPITHAIIHFDEADPHIHVIMVPIQGKRLPASKILGFKGVSRARLNDLYEKVAKEFGLSHPTRLTGAIKRRAAEITIKVCEKFDYRNILGRVWQPFVGAIQARPEPFMEALGVVVRPEDIGHYKTANSATASCVVVANPTACKERN